MKSLRYWILVLSVLGGLSATLIGANHFSGTCYMKYFMCCNDKRPLFYKSLTKSINPEKTGGFTEVLVDVVGYSNQLYSRMTISKEIKQYKSITPYDFDCSYSGKGWDKWGNPYPAYALTKWIQGVEGETEGPDGECSPQH
jgi:hypothetical protein